MYLGIDLGTSGVKVILMDDQQTIITSSTARLTISRPQSLWSEQNPNDWWGATQNAIRKIKYTHANELKKVRALAFSGQMHGATLLDKNDNPLRPAILWNDGRAMAQCHTLLQRAPRALEITGNLIMPGFTAPKVLWVQENEPALFQKIKKILLPKDYLRLLISGDYATDFSDASGTSWLDVGKRQWSNALLTATGLTPEFMPALYEGSAITGAILPAVADVFGIPKNAAVVGGGDNAASAISVNVTEPGKAFLSLGTSGVYFVASECFKPNPLSAVHTYCHCLPNLWHQMTVHLSAASCLGWLRRLLNLDIDRLNALIRQAKRDETNPNIPIFLPYLSGERTPHNDPYARGVFFGMTYETKIHHLVQAVLEGVAFAFAEGHAAMHATNVKIEDISVIGGGARNIYWGEILSAALNKPLIYRESANVGGAYGAARLAWLAINGGDPRTALRALAIKKTIEPDQNRVERYVEKQTLFTELYQQLKKTFANAYKQK